jgi:predicted HicB family RNase H-like nuclease
MKKDAQFTLRIPASLRKELQDIANHERRSLAQICEAFLRAGSEHYKKQSSKFLQQFLTKTI